MFKMALQIWHGEKMKTWGLANRAAFAQVRPWSLSEKRGAQLGCHGRTQQGGQGSAEMTPGRTNEWS